MFETLTIRPHPSIVFPPSTKWLGHRELQAFFQYYL